MNFDLLLKNLSKIIKNNNYNKNSVCIELNLVISARQCPKIVDSDKQKYK
jgi:hypothetical protein